MSKLQIDSVRKSFGSKVILQDVYLSCEKGEVVGLLGRNGTGKSTLLIIAFGMTDAGSSFIKIDDKIMRNQADRKGKLAYLPQHPFLPRNIKVKNLISLFCTRENGLLLETHPFIKPFLQSVPRQLSGGEQRAVENLLLIFSENEFVILDEPFHSLSPKIVAEIKNLIRQKCADKGFILSDHSYQDVMEVSDRLYLLSETSLKPVANAEELRFYGYLR